ncbi:MAG: hypothetical protein EA363_03750 [Balneolaceae bacterium]|nr:MAG: hypothetical protein EA363_03750 [Balneolaceae bacterium]
MLLIIYNKAAGNGKIKPIINRLGNGLNDQGTPFAIFEVNQFSKETAGELLEAGKIKRVLICGGDGTINRVINLLIDYVHDIEFGVIPCGTGNLFARSLKDSGPISLSDFTTEKYHPAFREVQVGQANSQFFLYVASVGLTADTVSAVEAFRDTAFGSFLFRFLGGFTIYVLTFFTVVPGKSLYKRFFDAPESRAWIRTCADPEREDFSLFSGLWSTIVHYRYMLMPNSILPEWECNHTPVTTDEYHIEHKYPFSWQVDGVPQQKTQSLKVGFHYRTMRVQAIHPDWE